MNDLKFAFRQMLKNPGFSAVAVLTLALGIRANAAEGTSVQNWPRFRGPNGTGVAETTGLPTDFGPAKNVVWKTPVPEGHSSPVLTETHIFLTGVEGDKLFVVGLDRASGRQLWRHEVPRARKGRLDGPNGPASPSPARRSSLRWRSPAPAR